MILEMSGFPFFSVKNISLLKFVLQLFRSTKRGPSIKLKSILRTMFKLIIFGLYVCFGRHYKAGRGQMTSRGAKN